MTLGTCSDPRAPWWSAAPGEAAAPSQPQLAPAAADGVFFVDQDLLRAAATPSPQLERTNPLYAAVAKAVRMTRDADEAVRMRADLDRLALIGPAARFVLVDTASARLWMVEGGRVAGSMKVITGKAGMETPMMAALIRHAVLNPYWNLPPDLVRERAARNFLLSGPDWLRRDGLRPVSHYGPGGELLDAETIDWVAVSAGQTEVGLRQEPGPRNTMGAVKFMFPNELGIYLHDTPERALFRAADRRFSSGCVRLERAGELYRWLFGAALPTPDPRNPEKRVELPAPVPVFILDLPSLKRVALPENVGRTVA